MEVYLLHYLLLTPIRIEDNPTFYSLLGMVLVLMNFLMTVVLVILTVMAISRNDALTFALMGKKNGACSSYGREGTA